MDELGVGLFYYTVIYIYIYIYIIHGYRCSHVSARIKVFPFNEIYC